MLVALAAALGLAVGSFLNVVIARVPDGISIVSPRSRCPRCDTEITARDNIPVLSWLLLGRRCRGCREPISGRYPLVELGTAATWGLIVWHWGLDPAVPLLLYTASTGIALAVIDIDTRRLPFVIVRQTWVVTAALVVLAAGLSGDWSGILRAAIGAAVLGAFYFTLVLIKPGGMGWGDFLYSWTLGGFLGWFGWGSLVVGAFSAFLVGGLVSVGAVAATRKIKGVTIPFGPSLIAGAFIGVALGESIIRWYLDISGL